MTKLEARIALLALFALASGCFARNEPQSGGHSNWLACESLDDCGASEAAVACEAGYCVDADGERVVAPDVDAGDGSGGTGGTGGSGGAGGEAGGGGAGGSGAREGWIEVLSPCGYSFEAPPDIRREPAQGTDSCVDHHITAACVYEGGYGAFPTDSTWLEENPGSSREEVTVDGQDATLRTGRGGAEGDAPHHAAIDFAPDGDGLYLGVFATCVDRDALDQALNLFQTLRSPAGSASPTARPAPLATRDVTATGASVACPDPASAEALDPCLSLSCPESSRCVHGGEGLWCECDPGYDGAQCDLCADGRVELGGACVTPCEAAGVSCAGECGGSVEAPVCGCPPGYRGDACEACAEGFGPDLSVFDALACIPTCDDACDAHERCVLGAGTEQRCDCIHGYSRDLSGRCAWDGLLADPGFELGCAAWRLTAAPANDGDVVRVEIVDDVLELSVSNVCDVAMAVTDVKLPAPDTVPDAALRFGARGEPGSALSAGWFDLGGLGLVGPLPGVNLRPETTFEGDGQWNEHRLCIPRHAGGPAALSFALGQTGGCLDRLDHAFSVQNLELVTDPSCAR